MVIVGLAFISDSAGRILLIEEAKPRVRGTWNLPGGRVEPGESLIDAVAREAREEAGVSIEIEGLLYVDQFAPADARFNARMRFVFRAACLSPVLKSEPDEHSLRAQWFAPAELPTVRLRNSMVERVLSLAASGAPTLPLASLHVVNRQEREREQRR